MSDDAPKPRPKRARREVRGAQADGAKVSSKAPTATAKSRPAETAPRTHDLARRPPRTANALKRPPSPAEVVRRERRLRIMIAASALTALLGIGVVGMSQAWFVGTVRRDQASSADPGPNGQASTAAGAAFTLLGAIVLMYSIHRFGRLGPDAPPRAPEPPADPQG